MRAISSSSRRIRAHHPFDGFVLTEHRRYMPGLALQRYWDEYGVRVFQAVEMNTNLGHLLVYGINARVLERFDLSTRLHDGRRILAELEALGAVAAPAHPFRESVFGSIMERDLHEIAGVQIIEMHNGQNTPEHNARSAQLVAQHGLRGLGGSDAHFTLPGWFLTCATAFEDTVTSEAELVEALRDGTYRPVVLPQG